MKTTNEIEEWILEKFNYYENNEKGFVENVIDKKWYSEDELKEVFNKHKSCNLCCENRYSENSTGNCVDNIIEELRLEE